MKQTLLLVSLFISSIMYAGPVGEKDAQQKAVRFMTAKTGVQRMVKATNSGVRRAAGMQQEPFYVFNLEGGGYIIVSGDDRTEDILGYSKTGTFDVTTIPDNMRSFLQEYADGIQFLSTHDVQTTTTSNNNSWRAPGESIAPILNRHWDQGNPYNSQCPKWSGETTVTGCVATAMAQIMGHYSWPAATTQEIPAYMTTTNRIPVGRVKAGTAIDWEHIIDSYASGYTYEQGSAIANLMKMCGSSVKMDYGLSSSGGSSANGTTAVSALVKYFDYEEETCRYLSRSNYSYEEWQDIIYKELQENRPVLYSGQSSQNGHMFIVDGYDKDEDKFHINWGWAGTSDAYYSLHLLKPVTSGIGGSDSEIGYAMTQYVGVGLKPNDGVVKEMPVVMTVFNVEMSKTAFTRTSEAQDFNIGSNIKYSILNDLEEDVTVDIGAYIQNSEGDVVKVVELQMGKLLEAGYYYTYNYSSFPKFGAGYADGEYKVVFVSRKSGATEWNICYNSGKYAVAFDIAGSQLTFKAPVYGLAITNVEMAGNKQAGSEQTIKVTVLNNGSTCRSDVYAYVNPYNPQSFASNVERVIPAAFIDLAKGESTTFEFKFTPSKSGVNKIYLVCDKQRIFGNAIEMEVTGGIDLSYVSCEPTTVKRHHDNIDYIYSNTAKFNIKVENKGEKAFRGDISVKLVGRLGFSYYMLGTTTVMSGGYIASNGSRDMTYDFDGTSWAGYGFNRYYFSLYYRESGENQEAKLVDLDDFEVRDIPVKVVLKDAQIEHSKPDEGTIEGDVFQLTSVLQNEGDVAFNDNVSVRVWELLPSTNEWTYTADAVAFELEAHDSKQFNYSFNNPAKEEGAKYKVEVYYTYDEEALPLHETAVYSFFSNPSGIEEVTSTVKSDTQKVYDMQGRQVGVAKDINTLKSGVYIIGGRKVVKK